VEKRTPHCDLARVQADVARLGAAAFTKTALEGGRMMGLTTAERLPVIASLARRQFYKSMATYADHRVWQDVYHAATPVRKDALHQDHLARRCAGDPVQGEVTMTRKCPNCETRKGMTRFEGETFTIEHAGMTAMVEELSGWRCQGCGEVEFDADSARRYAAAGDELVLRDRERQSREIRRIRRKLGLSQVAAARLTGGGHNAFSRYERGEAAPLPAVVNLFRLLDKHPELLKDLI
jgi:HTH-type transcriptional regulator/antitoxin MqsA